MAHRFIASLEYSGSLSFRFQSHTQVHYWYWWSMFCQEFYFFIQFVRKTLSFLHIESTSSVLQLICPTLAKGSKWQKWRVLVKEQNVSVIPTDVNGISWCLTQHIVGWVFMHKIWPARRAHWVQCKNINNSDLDSMSLASFCQSRAVISCDD